MDLPLTSQDSKGLIQSPGSAKAASRETSQDMLTFTAHMSVSVLDTFLCCFVFLCVCLHAYVLRHVCAYY